MTNLPFLHIWRKAVVRGCLILKSSICCFLFFKGPLFFISFWKTGTSRAVCSSQDWGHEMECICGFLSVTFYFSVKLLSHIPISNTWIVCWPFDDCYSPSYCCYGLMTIVIPLVTVVMRLVLVFLLNFNFCPKLPCITVYKHTLPWIKHPCFTRDLGPLRPSFCPFLFVDSSPQVPLCKDHDKWCLNRDLEYTLCKWKEWLWTLSSVSAELWDKWLESPTTFLFCFIIYLKFKDFWFRVSE